MSDRILLIWFCALLLWPLQAGAEIYTWRDAAGTLVLSDRKLDDGALTYAVPDAPTIRATRPIISATARERVEPFVQQYAVRQALRPDLVRAVIQVESGFNPRARSPKGAMGLMQLMPATAGELGVRDPYDPEQNIRGGTAYLRRLLDRYEGNEELALAAYNAGAEAVDRHGHAVPPFRETRDYVKRVTAAAPAQASRRPGVVVYTSFEIVDGRLVPRYSTTKPVSGTYEVVTR